MIKSTDLRIGNWYVNQWGEYLQVDPDLFGADNLESYPIPIPLNHEILEKCGFVKQYDECVFDFGNSRIEQVIWADSEPEWKFRRILGNDLTSWRHGMIAINYLHQLQNLYYSLTNEELEFKP